MKIIIYGANEMGSIIATEFFEDHDIIVIDPNKTSLDKFNNLDLTTICADASNINILKEADIKNADVFIACTNIDEGNIVACLIAKQLSDAKTVCFVSKKECRDSLRTIREEHNRNYALYIDHVIWPERLLVHEFLRIITVPDAVDVEYFSGGRAKLLEYRIKENSVLLNKKLKDCQFNEETLVVGLARDEELFIPNGESEFKLNDKAIFMGTPDALDNTAAQFFVEDNNIKNVTIIGGGSVGYELAKSLENTKLKIKLIEVNYKRCEFLSQELKKTLVLNGNGTNLELLEQEDTGVSDVAICVTNNDEKNLLCSLLTKQLGAKRAITRVSQAATASLFERVGVDVAISPNEAAVNEIKNRIIESHAGILATVERGLAEILELRIKEDFKDVALMDLRLPTRAVIAIIERAGKIIIPKGQTLLRAKDKLLIFTKSQDVGTIKDFFK